MRPVELQAPVPTASHQSLMQKTSTLTTYSSAENLTAHPEPLEGDHMDDIVTFNMERACEMASGDGEERDQCRCSGGGGDRDASARGRGRGSREEQEQGPGGGGVEDDCAEDRSSIGDDATECGYLTLWRADLFAITRAQYAYLARRSQMTCT